MQSDGFTEMVQDWHVPSEGCSFEQAFFRNPHTGETLTRTRSRFAAGKRVRHKHDGALGTILDWNTEKNFGNLRFDDGEEIPCDPSVLILMEG